MDAKKCDICNSFYIPEKMVDPTEYRKKWKNEGRPIISITIHTYGISKDFDLCPECGERLKNFLGKDKTYLN